MRSRKVRSRQLFRPIFEPLEDRRVLSTTLVSPGPAGIGGASYGHGVSADGRYVVFESYRDDLVGNDANGKRDVFLRDVQDGTTTLISKEGTGVTSANGDSFDPLISPDGRFIVYSSQATNIILGFTDSNGDADVFVYDRQTAQTQLISVAASGNATGDARSVPTDMSADGTRIVFVSRADNLVSGSVTDNNGFWDTFVRDLSTNQTRLISVQKGNVQSGDFDSGFGNNPQISANGRYVVFESAAHNLISDPTQASIVDNFGANDLFVRDLQTNITSLISVNGQGTAGAFGHSRNAVITPDARYVLFESDASDLVSNDTNGIRTDVFLRDLALKQNFLVSQSVTGGSGNEGGGGFAGAFGGLSISNDGRYAAFESSSSNLVANDTNGNTYDVFVRDMQSATTSLLSVSTTGGSGNNTSFDPILSPTGRFAVFRSRAGNLVTSDSNGLDDIFVRDLVTGATTLASINQAGTNSGGSYSNDVLLSGDAHYIVFNSAASDLVANDSNVSVDVFRRPTNVPTGEFQFSAASASISEDGGNIVLTIQRVNGSSGAAGISYATANGTATAGADYTSASGSLAFTDGQVSQTISIPILNDFYVEPGETFTVTLSKPTNDAFLGTTTTITVTITDQDVPAVIVQPVRTALTSEAGNTAQIKVYLASVPTADVTVALSSSNVAEGTVNTPSVTLTPANALAGQVVTITGVSDGVADGNVAYFLQTGNSVSSDLVYSNLDVADLQLTNLGSFAGNKTTFQDQDGDAVTVTLTGAGGFGLVLDDPDSNGKGPIQHLLIGGTNTTSSVLTVAVVKGAAGNGLLDLGNVQGTNLMSLSAPMSNVTGAGISFSGPLLGLTVNDIVNGADITTGGTPTQVANIAAKLIGDGTSIDTGTAIGKLKAARIDDALISAPRVDALKIKGDAARGLLGDFRGELLISGAGVSAGANSFGAATITGTVDQAAFTILAGNVGTFQTARFANSMLCAGYVPTNASDPMQGGTFTPGLKITSFTVTGTTDGLVNSTIAAESVGTVVVQSLDTTNYGMGLGVIADKSITKVKATTPTFKYIVGGAATQGVLDFQVKLV